MQTLAIWFEPNIARNQLHDSGVQLAFLLMIELVAGGTILIAETNWIYIYVKRNEPHLGITHGNASICIEYIL